MTHPRISDRILGLEPTLYPPTARELAESQDVREEFLRRVAARRGIEPSALRDAMRRHAVASDEIDLDRGGGGSANCQPSGERESIIAALNAALAGDGPVGYPAPVPGCAEAWPNLPTGAAGADPSLLARFASRWPGAGRLLLRAACLAALALYIAAALGVMCLAALGDR